MTCSDTLDSVFEETAMNFEPAGRREGLGSGSALWGYCLYDLIRRTTSL